MRSKRPSLSTPTKWFLGISSAITFVGFLFGTAYHLNHTHTDQNGSLAGLIIGLGIGLILGVVAFIISYCNERGQ